MLTHLQKLVFPEYLALAVLHSQYLCLYQRLLRPSLSLQDFFPPLCCCCLSRDPDISTGIITRYELEQTGAVKNLRRLVQLLEHPQQSLYCMKHLVLHLLIQYGVLFLEYELTHADTLAAERDTVLPVE